MLPPYRSNSRRRTFPNSTDLRWQWMFYASAAITPPAVAGTVQIDLIGNEISQTHGNNLNADLTGDGIDDLRNLDATGQSGPLRYNNSLGMYTSLNFVAITSTLQRVSARAANFYYSNYVSASSELKGSTSFIVIATGSTGSIYSSLMLSNFGETQPGRSHLFPISFSDYRINSGQESNGFLEVAISRTAYNDQTIDFVRLVFDDTSVNAPENVEIGGSDPAWVDPVAQAAAEAEAIAAAKRAAKISKLNRKIKKGKKQYKKALRANDIRMAKKIAKKVNKMAKQLRSLLS